MAVAVEALATYLGLESQDVDQTAELQDILDAAIATVELEAPSAPEAVKDLAIKRFSAYQFDQPFAARSQSFANGFVNSGAGSVLAKWVVRRLADPDDYPARS